MIPQPEFMMPDRCATCAFREGTDANKSELTQLKAMLCMETAEPFFCHEDPKQIALCRGWCDAVKARLARGITGEEEPWRRDVLLAVTEVIADFEIAVQSGRGLDPGLELIKRVEQRLAEGMLMDDLVNVKRSGELVDVASVGGCDIPEAIERRRKSTLPTIEDVKRLLDEGLSWPEELVAGVDYNALHDDHDGTREGWLSVIIGADGDAHVKTLNSTGSYLRFRTQLGGGGHVRTHNALVLLALAIHLDNEDGQGRAASRGK